MQIIYTKTYDQQLKKLKKHNNELNNLNKIINILERTNNYESLINSPIAKIYGYEKLKGELNNYSSFNLCKNGGMIRLLIKGINNKVILCSISYKHYKDFKKGSELYYDE